MKHKILVFTHGTIIMHKNAVGASREERVRQSKEREESVLDGKSYVPIGDAVNKLNKWKEQGANIVYLSPNESIEGIEREDKVVLEKHGFPKGEVYFRREGKGYGSVIEKIMPDIFIEDDCESIGGQKEVGYFQVSKEASEKIKSIIVPEFGGIDHLPDHLDDLCKYKQ